MRTFDRATFEAAKAQWESGDFGWQWNAYRKLAAERGFLYPPTGTKHDDRQSPAPSQRAIVWRAIEERPAELERIVRRSRSWSDVVDGIFGMEARLAVEADDGERDAEWDKDSRPDLGMRPIASVFERIAESLGYVKADR